MGKTASDKIMAVLAKYVFQVPPGQVFQVRLASLGVLAGREKKEGGPCRRPCRRRSAVARCMAAVSPGRPV